MPLKEGSSARGVDYLFLRIPKTGSTSVCRAIKRPFDHKTAKEWVELMGQKEYDDRYKFSIVRHPYERYVSMYYFFGIFRKLNGYGPNELLKEHSLKEVVASHKDGRFLKPQTDFLYIGDKKMVDYIGRYEQIDDAWSEIRKHIGGLEKLPKWRVCRYDKDELTQESKDRIYEFYEKDFEVLGYERN